MGPMKRAGAEMDDSDPDGVDIIERLRDVAGSKPRQAFDSWFTLNADRIPDAGVFRPCFRSRETQPAMRP